MATPESNPFVASAAPATSGRTQALRPLVWSGVAMMLLAAVCLAVSIGMMFLSFQTIANSSASPQPAELATGIGMAMLPLRLSLPLGLVGLVLLVAGLLIRRPVKEPA